MNTAFFNEMMFADAPAKEVYYPETYIVDSLRVPSDLGYTLDFTMSEIRSHPSDSSLRHGPVSRSSASRPTHSVRKRLLENFFQDNCYPTRSEKAQLGKTLGITQLEVDKWFVHRRGLMRRLRRLALAETCSTASAEYWDLRQKY